MSTVSGGCHSTPNNVSCMSISLNVSEFHAGHDIIWNVNIVGHEDVRKLAMRIELFLSWESLLLLKKVGCVGIQYEVVKVVVVIIHSFR